MRKNQKTQKICKSIITEIPQLAHPVFQHITVVLFHDISMHQPQHNHYVSLERDITEV